MSIIDEVGSLELKKLVYAIKDSGSVVGIRFRMAGQLWSNNFCKVLTISEIGIALLDQDYNKLHFIRDLGHIMQFELDSSFQAYQPNFHYSVAWEPSVSATLG